MASRARFQPQDRRAGPPNVKVEMRLTAAPVSPNEIRIVLDALGAELARLFKDEAG